MLRRFAAEGRRDVLTLGVTPVLAAQLDDPYCLRGVHDWLGNWHLRAHFGRGTAAASWPRTSTARPSWALDRFESAVAPRVLAGAAVRSSTRERSSCSAGPPRIPFQPLLDPRVRAFALRTGLDDTGAARRPRAGRDLGAGVRLRARHGAGVRGGGRAAVPGRRARAARRHVVRAPRRRLGRAGVRPRPRGHRTASGRRRSATRATRAYRDFHTYDHPSGPQAVPGDRQATWRRRTSGRTTRRWRATAVDSARRRLRGDGACGGCARSHGRPRRGRLRHRAVRALVARGSGVAGGRAAGAARSGRAGDDVAGRRRGRARRRAGRAAGVVVGRRARTGACGTARRCRTSCR